MATLRQRIHRARKTTCSRSVRWQSKLRRALSRRAHCLFVTALPKSASSYLTSLLAAATGYIPYSLVADHANEQDLDLTRLVDSWSMNCVSHHHTRVTPANLRLIAEFGIKPVILTRNVFDCMVSLRDHLVRENQVTPLVSVGSDYPDWPPERQLDLVVDLAAPWYFRFVAGWQTASVKALWIDYNAVVDAPTEAAQRIFNFHDIAISEARIADAVQAVGKGGAATIRFNRGEKGRGCRLLSTAQQDRLRALGRHFPQTDLGPLGI